MIRARGFAAAGLLLSAALGSRLEAQGMYFGQNQVQFEHFDWQVMETEHFLVHYYPAERVAALDAARMAERSYARLSRILGHQFREKKPIVLFASRGDFAQNNVTGDLGEGTGGVTDPLRHRMMQPFTGDYASFEHVLAHEMVHEFQFDIFARGKAGAGLQALGQVNPPLWYMEGMAEYLSIGYKHPQTDTWVRDAAINGNLPTIEEMTMQPQRFFPYRYGFALWQYIGTRWGDEAVGNIMSAVPNVGIERAFKRELGLSLEELSDEWKEAMQTKHLPQLGQLDRPRKFAQPLLSQRKSGGIAELFIAPSLSHDGKHIAFISYGSWLRGEVFPELYLADAQTGKRLGRLVKTTTNPDFEELRMIYSQSSFSPDGRTLAFTAQRGGKDVLYLLDVRRRKVTKRFDLPLEGVTSPSWSPDGRRLVLSGTRGGISDLYVVDADGKNFRQLTDDRYGDNQPQWSPDGKHVAWASDRGPETDFELLRIGDWKVATLNLETGRIDVPAGQGGLNINPMWSPDGQSIAYVSDRTGIANLFLYDVATKDHYQLTNVVGAVNATTEYSPAITWARQADVLAFTYYANGDFTVWSVKNPRALRSKPFVEAPAVVAARDSAAAAGLPGATARPAAGGSVVGAAVASAMGGTAQGGTPGGLAAALPLDSSVADPFQASYYRTPAATIRASAALPVTARNTPGGGALSVTALLDSAALALPDTTSFKHYRYRAGFQPEYVAQPQIGYAQDNFGQGVFGGTMVILGDLLGNHKLAFAGEVNGQISDARLYAGYMNLSRRLQYNFDVQQSPIFFYNGTSVESFPGGREIWTQEISRFVVRQIRGFGMYPLNRFTRVEFGAQLNNVSRSVLSIRQAVDRVQGVSLGFERGPTQRLPGLNYAAPYLAYVSDNSLFGYTGPIMGRRYRFQVEPTIGSMRWTEYTADYRRYDPILFNFLTISTRFMSSIGMGRDEMAFPKYIGRPDFIRGYNRENFTDSNCSTTTRGLGIESCGADQLLGSRVALGNAELRFPLIRRFDLGLLPIALPPLDGLVFYDAGIAWRGGQSVTAERPDNYDWTAQRYLLTSYGFGVRLNLFGFAILRYDWAKPLDRPGRKGFGTWSFGPSF